MRQGAFIVEPRKLGGDLYLVEGSTDSPSLEAPLHVLLDGTTTSSTLGPEQLAALELELIGPHRKLLSWDCESPATSPELGEITPLEHGHGVRRVAGQAGVGVSPTKEAFVAEPGARLRLRVKTSAAAMRVEFRVLLGSGYRLVDARVDVRGNDQWQVIDVPLSILRAGRFRAEPGWLPGRTYSAFLLSPAADPNAPLARHDFLLDDLLVTCRNRKGFAPARTYQ
jgi:hypothetical protein